MNRIIVVHGSSPRNLAISVAEKEGLTLVEVEKYNSVSDLFRETESVVVYGSLYKVEERSLTSTAIHHFLSHADQVHRQRDTCSLCGMNVATITLSDETLCRTCCQDTLERRPPVILMDGEVVVEGTTVTVKLDTIMMARKRTCDTVEESLTSAIVSLNDYIPGPGIHLFRLVTPRSIGEDVLSRVKLSLGSGVMVEWK